MRVETETVKMDFLAHSQWEGGGSPHGTHGPIGTPHTHHQNIETNEWSFGGHQRASYQTYRDVKTVFESR